MELPTPSIWVSKPLGDKPGLGSGFTAGPFGSLQDEVIGGDATIIIDQFPDINLEEIFKFFMFCCCKS